MGGPFPRSGWRHYAAGRMPCSNVHLALFGALFLALPAVAEDEPAPPAEGPKTHAVLVLDLEGIDVDADKMKIVNGTLVDTLAARPSLEIISQGDIRQMVDFEAEKQAMGCDSSSCLAEMAGAMGASYVVFGRVGRLDDVLFVQLNLFDSGKGRAVAREEVRAQRLSELPDVMRPALARLVSPLTGETPPPAAVTTTAPSEEPGVLTSPLLWSGVVVAGAGLAAGVGLLGGVLWADATLGEIGAPIADKNTAADLGPWMFAGALAGAAVSAGGLALVGTAFFLE